MNKNDDIERLFDNLPHFVQQILNNHPNKENLLEVVLDLGRRPEARFIKRSEYLSRKIMSSQDLDFILNERLVELHWEGHRRQDLIRFNKYTGGSYNWSWKGNSVSGIPLAATRSVFPIPSASLAANPNLKQNSGY